MARKTNSSYFSPVFFKFEGDSLKRPPIGFNANREFIKDLMLKDVTAGVPFRNSQVTSARFLEEFV